jgi:hypothetical protein
MSSEKEILDSRVKGLRSRQKLLTDKLTMMQESYDLETRAEEKLRQKKIISDTEADLREIGQEILKLTNQTNQSQPSALKVFYSYAHEDEDMRDKLHTHLKILERQGLIEGWYDRDITGGSEWEKEIIDNLQSAQIILLLISSDFLASDFCWSKEMDLAMERHEDNAARVIPIIVRDCDWSGAPFGKLQALPKNARPVEAWSNRNEAFTDVARGIRKVAEQLLKH